MLNNDIIFAGMPGGQEIALIALVILLIFGAKRLPGLARGLGQGIREFKGAVDGVKDELKDVQESVDTPEEDKEVQIYKLILQLLIITCFQIVFQKQFSSFFVFQLKKIN